MELLAGGRSIGYLLKSRITVVDEFLETLDRIRRGGSVIDPSLVQELVAAQRRDDPLSMLSNREREVLGLMAEGRSNAGSAVGCGSPRGRSRSMCGASWASCGCPRSRTTTVGSWPC